MPEPEHKTIILRGWVEKAENDLKTAAHTLKLGEECPTDTVCFHAQQCVEKYLKALLILSSTDFPRIHDLEKLLALIPKPIRPNLSESEQGLLTDYATVTRYPGDYEDLSISEARRAVALARRIRKEVRTNLPLAVLRRRVPRRK